MRKDPALINPAFNRLVKTDKGDSNREQIELYLVAGGEGVELNDKQKELLERWTFADEMIRANMGKLTLGEIANLIVKRFNVSSYKAKADIVSAETVFASGTPLNKKHRIQLRVEFLEKQSRLAAAEKDFKAVGMIEKSIAKYLEIYPDILPDQSPKTIIYNILNARITEETIATEEADFIIEEHLKQLPDAGE